MSKIEHELKEDIDINKFTGDLNGLKAIIGVGLRDAIKKGKAFSEVQGLNVGEMDCVIEYNINIFMKRIERQMNAVKYQVLKIKQG